MPRKSKADFYVSRIYTHAGTETIKDEEGNETEVAKTTVDRPDPDVTARIFQFWPDKETRDTAEETEAQPEATFTATLTELPPETLSMLAAVGLNVRMNQQIDPKQTVEKNIDNCESFYELLKSGQLREVGGSSANYVGTFVKDFCRMLSLKFETDYTVQQAQQAIEKASKLYEDEEDFSNWKKAVMADGFFQQAKAERMAAKAAKSKEKQAENEDAVDPLAGLLGEPATE